VQALPPSLRADPEVQRPAGEKCPKCKVGRVEKLISAPAVQFKGTGWYVTDYGGKKGSGEKSGSGDKGDSGGKDSSEKSASSSSDKKDSGKPTGKSGGSGKTSTE
jgi:hypothetical protein